MSANMIEKYSVHAAHLITEKDEHGEEYVVKAQSIKQHCENVAELAGKFADCFGARETAELCGLAHDIGKYSKGFQKRIWENGTKVDHSTAGAKELYRLKSYAYPCVAGHHSGLSDIQALISNRLSKDIPNYDDYKNDITLKKSSEAFFLKSVKGKYVGFALSFYIRMLFSCLVDADYLDTERFMLQGHVSRSGGQSVDILCERLDAYICRKKWLDGKEGINAKRSRILKRCLNYGGESTPGIFTLTVPTGGGKTGASLAFALQHAKRNGMKRIIYVVPYCTIIDQTVRLYSEILGEENVLAHYSEPGYEDAETEEESNGAEVKKLATENWDMPVIVTTAVQFFESLFSNRTSKCRKLHNIADSVVVFDEAQTIPVDFLRPCVYAMTELTLHYHTTCVLSTATQPSLGGLIREYDDSIAINEICDKPDELYDSFIRVQYEKLGEISVDELINQMEKYKQVLCIVSTRSQAKRIFELLPEKGSYHLSTWMTPNHRRNTLDIIKDNLKSGRTCRVISTSLIEAGVDVDFPAVFRSMAGIDSIIQAGGRCNREGRNPKESSRVFIFRLEGEDITSASMRLPAETAESVMRSKKDIASPGAVKEYFELLHSIKGGALDRENIVKKLNTGKSKFEEVGRQFQLIDSRADKMIFIPDNDTSHDLANEIRGSNGFLHRDLYRRAGKYSVAVSKRVFDELRPVLEIISEDFAILAVSEVYSCKTGLMTAFEGGKSIFL